jgi:hypothetical protein
MDRQLLRAGQRGRVGGRLELAVLTEPRSGVDDQYGHPEQDREKDDGDDE